ncbi:MAG: tyrosine--tRNA ligase [Bacilli bacterium]|nr:tyrosine--tRNA ligase [Bacilli bacterium]
MTLYEELVWRGLVKDISSLDLIEKLNKGGLTFYIGTDPTADSLHIGHFSSFLISKRLKDAGHNPILLVGGATGLIGDPRPSSERPMITKEEVRHNFDCLKRQAEDLFGFEVVNNFDWIKDINVIDFLRDYGKYFNVNYMLDKDIIKRRLDSGITYTEFSYMLLQALDFLHLHNTRGVDLQVAGQDQWGNITAGLDLIRKKTGDEVYCFTMPLLTKKDGTKFGKSEGGAIWLDRNKTSPYELYQFLINAEDEKVIDYLKFLTFLSVEDINILEESLKNEPEKRLAQKALAREVVKYIHGEEGYIEAINITESLFSGNVASLSLAELEQAFKGLDAYSIDSDICLVDLLVDSLVCKSKREAREFITNSSISVNGERVNDLNFMVTRDLLLHDKYIIIRRGKKKYYLVSYK